MIFEAKSIVTAAQFSRASKIGNTWRMSNDIYNAWRSIWRITNQVVPYWRNTRPGAFPDMDMLLYVCLFEITTVN